MAEAQVERQIEQQNGGSRRPQARQAAGEGESAERARPSATRQAH
jgi:hypothetical protein